MFVYLEQRAIIMLKIILENIYFCQNPIWQVLIVLIGSVGGKGKNV